MAEPQIESVSEKYILGEGPHWDERTQTLYFVDITAAKICRLNPATGVITSATLDCNTVGFVIPVEGKPGKLVVGADKSFALVSWDGESNAENLSFTVLARLDTDAGTTRINDGKADSSGRFWGGTMAIEQGDHLPPNEGSFYSIGSDLVPKKELSPVSVSNGLAWSLDDKQMYYIDSLTRQVFGFDYDAKSGTISNKRVVFDLEKNDVKGYPDGMTIDADGNLWVALYLGYGVMQVNPKTGKLLRTVKVPAERVTSVAFGGPNLDVLYVTSSSFLLSDDQLKEQPQAGQVFAVKGLGTRGLKANTFKLKE